MAANEHIWFIANIIIKVFLYDYLSITDYGVTAIKHKAVMPYAFSWDIDTMQSVRYSFV
jgi:hypothetical protein